MVTRLNEIKFIDELDIKNKVVFIRCDFNVPLKDGKITDPTRIESALETIKYALEEEAKVVLGSHLGRPKGKYVKELSLLPVADYLVNALKRDILLTDKPNSNALRKMIEDMKSNQVILLENLRYESFEKKNNLQFAQNLASHFDVYINDAFGTSHRAHASTVGIPKFMKEKGAGFLIKRELEKFNHMLENPESPFIAVLGGAKVSGKIGVIENLMDIVDTIIIGGAMANTFMVAKGYDMGKSLVEEDAIEVAKLILSKAKRNNVEFLLPVDFIGADKFSLDAKYDNYTIDNFPKDRMALDIGEKTVDIYRKVLLAAKTVFWNGPMGVFELEPFAQGTLSIAVAITKSEAYSVVGGGDSVAAINHIGLADKINHVSTGGGASLEYIEGKELPALTALKS